MKKPIISSILPAFTLLLASPLSARTATWQGTAGDGKWTTTANWADDTPPTELLDAIFDTTVALTVDLDGADVIARSLDVTTASTSGRTLTISGDGSLTLASGNLTKSGTAGLTLASGLVLGASGEWNTATAVTVTGAISDGGEGHGITKTGVGALSLYGASTWSGGFEMAGGSVQIYHNAALGTGTLKLTSGTTLGFNFNGSALANAIELNGTTTDWRMGTAAGLGREVTLSGAITGTGNLRTRGGAGTWRFTNTINLTGSLQFTASDTATTGAYTSILSAAPTLTNNIRLGLDDAAASFNLLFDQAGAYGGFTNITVLANNARNTIAGTHDTGSVTLAPTATNGIVLNNTANNPDGAANFATLHQAATTRIDKRITDSGGATPVPVFINATWQQVDAAATAAANTAGAAAYTTWTPTGVVEFAATTGNTYAGGTTVEAGTLRVTNTSGSATGAGAVLVKTGARLDGTGIIAPTGAAGIRIADGATLAAGDADSPGTLRFDGGGTTAPLLTLDAGATLEFRLGSPGVGDRIDLWSYTAGDLVFSNNTVNILDVGGLAEGTWTLFAFYADSGSDVSVVSGILSGLTLGAGLEAFSASHFVYADNRIDLVVASSIPEASTWLWVVLPGLLGIALHQRRRHPRL
ncbi:autotransporter [Opitutaceae bacterium TAV5]|nr:autotransporter [Opitutaceae bacterium TAV5]